jgi:hypothetical protein
MIPHLYETGMERVKQTEQQRKGSNQGNRFEPGAHQVALREARVKRLFRHQDYSWCEGPNL